ncbi:DUF3683 domain-containing protein [Magnetofaba australis]|nr:DUF3683 domain-containing protein [Magnetofaba australis]
MRIREIPYNYTSFSDREVVIRLLGEPMWRVLDQLSATRKTGRSARMLFEILGDIWMVTRNPLIQDDLQENPKRLLSLTGAMHERLRHISERAEDNPLTMQLVEKTTGLVNRFEADIRASKALREKAIKRFGHAMRRDNVDFSAVARVSHVTDATDWRVAYPFVCLAPDSEEEMLEAVAGCIDLDLIIVPRGGGTGYTGSAVPLHETSAVINTEKLVFVDPVVERALPGLDKPVATIRVGAGAVTKRVAEMAESAGYVFAVDPTSQNACTIGGNIAMNAGGKKAVLWGVCIDNLASWRMVVPDNGEVGHAHWLEVERVGHNLGKIHDVPDATFRITRFGKDGNTPLGAPVEITIPAAELRKPGLGKDVTNKALRGLPGIQKEGCDGLITSAVFVVHRMPKQTRTVCLEFFGHDLSKSVPAIAEVLDDLQANPLVQCAGLEHLDDRYVKAVGYNTKSARSERPKMVLVADFVSDDEAAVTAAAELAVQRVKARDGEGFVAASPAARARFWADRSRTAAIAAHTNAFKINEDVVIPILALAEYSAGIERINIEQSIHNKLRILNSQRAYLAGNAFHADLPSEYPTNEESEKIITDKRDSALKQMDQTARRWEAILGGLDRTCADMADTLAQWPDAKVADPTESVLNLLLRHDLRISYREEAQKPLANLFGGDLWSGVRAKLDEIHAEIRTSRIFVALHMHAGDGNIHTNIPVNSNDYMMLQTAEEIVDRIMELATGLGGVISGEHGIGITKIQYLPQERIDEMVAYKKRVDPKDRFNRGKLTQRFDLEHAYTPSLRLVQQEALILRESELGALNDDVRNCLRCGKCKPVCTTHVPQANLLYSPRNKILAAGLMIEAFLYEEQTRRGISVRHFTEMNDLADHCTVCHQCFKPCPVKIDFGKVTMRMRHILLERKQRRTNLSAKVAMGFLNRTDPRTVRILRQGFVGIGFKMQRMIYNLARKWRKPVEIAPPPHATVGRPSIPSQIVHFVERPLPGPINTPKQTMRASLQVEDPSAVQVFSDPAKVTDSSDAVFYFPGCGCERLYSDASLATIAMLNHVGAQTVIPPNYACCGYPQASIGDEPTSRRITTENRVLFHRIANQLNYLDIKTVLVSCGTCLTQLSKYEFDAIFPGCRVMDIHEYLMEKGVKLAQANGDGYLFHDPCHTPMKAHDPMETVTKLTASTVQLTDRCCGEAGTFAVARPDVAAQVRFRKQQSLMQSREKLGAPAAQDRTLLTTCPACVQGLSRYVDEVNVTPRYVVVELAEKLLGPQWREQLKEQCDKGGLERVLL